MLNPWLDEWRSALGLAAATAGRVFLAGICISAGLRAAEPEHLHDPAYPAGSGLHLELIAGITKADFLKTVDESRTAILTVIAAFTDANNGMNFNGASHGGLVFTIPVGWKVQVNFINPSPAPHSAVVVERERVTQMKVGEPAFAGASTPYPDKGLSVAKSTFSFVADVPGEYAIVCGLPFHATAGHWLGLDVSASAAKPTLESKTNSPTDVHDELTQSK